MNRRAFISTVALAPQMASALQADRKIRTAMIGTGHGHANSKAKALGASNQYELVGVCRPDEKDPIRGDVFAKAKWLNLAQVLEDDSIEMVAVEGADPKWNLDYAWRSIQAGKHVHLDKPPGADYNGLRDLLAEAGRKKLHVQMGYQWRYQPAMAAVLDAARKGWLGEVYRFRASIDKQIHAAERSELARYKGGMMFSEGCHLIDQATALFGKPEKVKGFLHHRSSLQDGLMDNALVVLEFKNAIAEISMAGFDPNGNEHRYLEVLGDNGVMRAQPFWTVHLHTELQKAAGPYPAGQHNTDVFPDKGYPYNADFQKLFGMIRRNEKPDFSPEHDLMTHRVLLEACGMLSATQAAQVEPRPMDGSAMQGGL